MVRFKWTKIRDKKIQYSCLEIERCCNYMNYFSYAYGW